MSIYAHGTRKRHAQGCRCNLCVLVDAAYGPPTSGSVPAAKTRDHIHALQDAGWTINAIADRSGYSRQCVGGIGSGRTLFTSRFIAEDIQSIPVGAAA